LYSIQFDGGAVDNIKKHLDEILETFEQIWTHNDELLQLNPKFKWTPAYGSYIKNFGIHPKTKMASMITSNKRWTRQHEIRHDFAMANQDKIDVFGRGIQEITNKEIGLVDYRFSFCVENDTYDTYFTEKILDCFATGTIPIYKGTKNIINHFDHNGILFLDDFNVKDLNEDLYYSKMDSIKSNLEKVKEYLLPEEYIYNKHIKIT
jgi:hypothetical protein